MMITEKEKQLLNDWLSMNLQFTSKSNVELIVAHIDRYFSSTPSKGEGKEDAKCDPHWFRGNRSFGKRVCVRCGQYEGESPSPVFHHLHFNDARNIKTWKAKRKYTKKRRTKTMIGAPH